jgi:hypothetical protein
METGEGGAARKRLAKTRSRTAAGETGAAREGEWLEAGEKAEETEAAEKGEA